MLRQISFSLLAVGFLVQVLAVLLSSPYAPQDFAKRRTLALLSHSADTDASESRIVKPKILHVLLLTAHPDDEAMFFGPTLVGMNVSLLTTPGKTEPVHETASKLSPKVEIPESFVQKDRDTFVVYSLCLSPGGTPGSELAERRKREIGMSLERLGVPPERRWVLDTPFEDNITLTWDPALIAKHVRPFVEIHSIDTIFTFDDNGVSSHPNHISLYHGAKHLIRTLSHADLSKTNPKPRSPTTKVPRLFTLRSLNLPNKYSGAFGALLTRAHISTCILHRLASPPDWPLAPRIGDMLGCPTREYATFVSNFRGYIVALVAMLTHRSQMVWFRWLYVGWSRYMWVNDWVEVTI